MKESRDWKKKRNQKLLTPEKLMHILNQIEGGERAKETYMKLTGKEPPALGDAMHQGFNIKAESEE